MYEDLIPTFEVGERVLYRVRKVELTPCPLCGKETGTKGNKREYIGKIDIHPHPFPTAICGSCHGVYKFNPEGWWRIRIPEYEPFTIIAPYTLLEKIGSR